jgi:hypothetical protein
MRPLIALIGVLAIWQPAKADSDIDQFLRSPEFRQVFQYEQDLRRRYELEVRMYGREPTSYCESKYRGRSVIACLESFRQR